MTRGYGRVDERWPFGIGGDVERASGERIEGRPGELEGERGRGNS